MATQLYLDTARLGLMSTAAQRIGHEYSDLIATEGCSPCFEEFLWHGSDAWSSRRRSQFPMLATWNGVDEVKSGIRRLAGFHDDLPVFLASRSCELFRIAARFLCRNAQRILTTDSEWPGYASILQQEVNGTNATVFAASTDDPVGFRSCDLIDRLAHEWKTHSCDGLFVSAVNHLGRTIPLSDLLTALNPKPSCVVVDGAQHLCHVPELLPDEIDFYIAGGHKWLGSGLPIGIGVCGRNASVKKIETFLHQQFCEQAYDDPLLSLIESRRLSRATCCGETVNVAPLLNCHAAMSATSEFLLNGRRQLKKRVANAIEIHDSLSATTWKTVYEPANGIIVARSTAATASPAAIRLAFQKRGLAVSAFEGGFMRLSMPSTKLTGAQIRRIAETCQRLA
jgi:selenocysteine lyase/cysteine desulfurase